MSMKKFLLSITLVISFASHAATDVFCKKISRKTYSCKTLIASYLIDKSECYAHTSGSSHWHEARGTFAVISHQWLESSSGKIIQPPRYIAEFLNKNDGVVNGTDTLKHCEAIQKRY